MLAEKDWATIRRSPLFSKLPIDALEVLLTGASVQDVTAQTIIFLQGDDADRFYAILNGWVKLSRNGADGEETVINVFAAGETFAEAAMFDSGQFPVTAEAVSTTRLLKIPSKTFFTSLSSNHNLSLNMLSSMSRHLRYLVQQVEQLHAKSAAQRVGTFMLLLSPYMDEPARIRLPYDKSLVAARLGMTPETFSRALAKLRPLGVRSEGHDILLDEPVALQRFCDGGG